MFTDIYISIYIYTYALSLEFVQTELKRFRRCLLFVQLAFRAATPDPPTVGNAVGPAPPVESKPRGPHSALQRPPPPPGATGGGSGLGAVPLYTSRPLAFRRYPLWHWPKLRPGF